MFPLKLVTAIHFTFEIFDLVLLCYNEFTIHIATQNLGLLI